MLILKPKGKGNWAKVTMSIEGRRVSPLLIRVGALIVFGGIEWRVCQVLP